ncbi:MAG: hypothetical protein JW912_07640 [Sedimentisphaerales bacterium]|nr:hypothetical protein [Sedimentisphaerales bacterium]
MNKDSFHKITNWIDHNRGQFLGAVVPAAIVLMLFGLFGCSRTKSLIDPTQTVDRQTFAVECLTQRQTLEERTINIQAELKKHNADIDTYNQLKQAGLDDLAEQDQLNQQILEIASGAVAQYASGGSVSIAPMIISALNLAGIGWGIGNKIDNTRKDKIIAEQKA